MFTLSTETLACLECASSCAVGDYTGAKDGLARMKYLANIEDELIEKLDVE